MTSCSDWDIRYPCDVSEVDPVLLETVRDSAQTILWSLSGRRYGICQTTESYRTPCDDPCYQGILYDMPVGVQYEMGVRYRHPCCRLYLHSLPVRAIVEVTVNGVLLDPSEYALERDVLWRNGECWPCDSECDEPPVVVEYIYGIDPPPLAELAMGELACELLSGIEGADCRLPSNAVAITRQGVTVDLGDVRTLFEMGRIGLPICDAFLRSVNPNHLQSRSMVYSPDLGRRSR
jgi:hypothetical protein